MEIDRPASQDNQRELNQVMMLPEIYGAFNDFLHSSAAAPHFLDNPNLSASASLLNFPTSCSSSDNISFTGESPAAGANPTTGQKKINSMATMREMIFRKAVMQPIHIDPESVKPPKRRNVKISKDPQSVGARHRRERISEKIRILQQLVPGGTKMDTASMLDEAIHYVKFLKTQVQSLEKVAAKRPAAVGVGFPLAMCESGSYPPAGKGYQIPADQNAEHFHGEANRLI